MNRPGTRTTAKMSLALCLGLGFLPAVRAETDENPLTLQDAIGYGLDNNTRLQGVFSEWQSSREQVAIQSALPDPTFTYGYYFDSVETRVGPQDQSFALNLRFPAFGKLSAARAAAEESANAAYQHYRQEELNLIRDIVKAYAELYFVQRNIATTRDRIRLVRDLEEVARTRYTAGSPIAPVLQAQVELGRLEDRLASLEDLLHPARARLNALLDRSADSPLSITSSLPYRNVGELDPDSLQQTGTSPQILQMEAMVAEGSHQVDQAKRARLPDIILGVTYIDTGPALNPVPDSGKDPVIGSIGFNLPIWPAKNRARIEAAAYRRTAAEMKLEDRRETLDSEIRQTTFDLRDAERKISLYRDSLIPKARQSLEVNRQGYEAGGMEFINLIDAERMLLEFELAYERALADHLIARAELSRLTGTDFLNADGTASPVGKK